MREWLEWSAQGIQALGVVVIVVSIIFGSPLSSPIGDASRRLVQRIQDTAWPRTLAGARIHGCSGRDPHCPAGFDSEGTGDTRGIGGDSNVP